MGCFNEPRHRLAKIIQEQQWQRNRDGYKLNDVHGISEMDFNFKRLILILIRRYIKFIAIANADEYADINNIDDTDIYIVWHLVETDTLSIEFHYNKIKRFVHIKRLYLLENWCRPKERSNHSNSATEVTAVEPFAARITTCTNWRKKKRGTERQWERVKSERHTDMEREKKNTSKARNFNE